MKKKMTAAVAALTCLFVLAACGTDGGAVPDEDTATVAITLIGAGAVTSEPAGIDCTAGVDGAATGTCSAAFDADSPVELVATPAEGFDFVGWKGLCEPVEGAPTRCGFAPAATAEIVATFEASEGDDGGAPAVVTVAKAVKALRAVETEAEDLALAIADSELGGILTSIAEVLPDLGTVAAPSVALRSSGPVDASVAALRSLATLHALPTGRYWFDDVDYRWRYEETTDGDLTVEWSRWTADEERVLRAVLDWNAGGETEVVGAPDGDAFEVPTAPALVVTYRGEEIGRADAQLSWGALHGCADVAWPLSADLTARIGTDGADLVVDGLGFDLTETGDDGAALRLDAALHASAGGASIGFAGDATVSGRILGENVCDFADVEPTGGSLALALTSTAHSLDVVVDVAASGAAFELSDGIFAVDGETAAFGGTLDGLDGNGDGVLGEEVSVAFDDGETTLERFLIDHFVD